MFSFFTQFLFVLGILLRTCSPQVLELTETFPEMRKEGGNWLVKFYAPWCGHCKRLEPIWMQVNQALAKSDIKVRRVDCSRFPSVVAEFEIRGYPTIKFITKDSDHTFNGDRTKEDIVNFAIRMAGPPVQEITQPENLAYIKNVLNHLFFMYVGNKKDNLWNSFKYAASKWQPYSLFYSASPEIASQHLKVPEVPNVMVFKENITYFFSDNIDDNIENLNVSLSNWINEERFEIFPKITRGNINEIIQISKYIVLVIVEENNKQIPNEMSQFMNNVASLINKYRNKYHKHFQFGWVGNPELANSIAMQVLPLPYLFVLNSSNYYYYVPEDEVLKMTPEAIDLFLEGVQNQTVPAHGGNSVAIRMYRAYFDSYVALLDMWRGNPILTVILFGLPCIFLSFICYSVWGADYYDEEDDEEHAKKE